MKLHNIATAALLALATSAATAAPIVLSNSGTNFLGTTDNGGTHTDQGISGRGILGGAAGGEIGVGETLVMDLGASYTIKSFQLGLVYDGPEFGDPNEVAQVSFFDGANSSLGAYTLTITGTTTASWTGPGTVSNLSPADQPGAGHWKVDDLNIANVSKIEFTALSQCFVRSVQGCSNDSDFIVTSVTAVPEPGTYAMFLAGLGALGFIAKRRKPRA